MAVIVGDLVADDFFVSGSSSFWCVFLKMLDFRKAHDDGHNGGAHNKRPGTGWFQAFCLW